MALAGKVRADVDDRSSPVVEFLPPFGLIHEKNKYDMYNVERGRKIRV